MYVLFCRRRRHRRGGPTSMCLLAALIVGPRGPRGDGWARLLAAGPADPQGLRHRGRSIVLVLSLRLHRDERVCLML